MPKLRTPLSKIENYPEYLEHHWVLHKMEKSKDAPTVISTFAGCGGSSLGYSMAGYRELLAVEWNDNAVETFKLNFPDVQVYHGDIHNLTVNDCLQMTELAVGQLDILDGSPPCQGFSTAGKRQLKDSRNQLAFQYIRLLKGLKPKVFVMENVSGMVKGKMKLVFADIMKALKESGYKVKVKLLNAMYFGVPQSRERLIFIGIRNDVDILPSYPGPKTTPPTVRQAIGDLPDYQDNEICHIWIDEVKRKTKWGDPKILSGVPCGRKVRANSTYIRLFWNRPSNTLTTGIEGIPLYVSNCHVHPSKNRALSVREFARIGSFPDKFVFVDAIHYASARIGNSVPPLMMYHIAKHIKENVLERI